MEQEKKSENINSEQIVGEYYIHNQASSFEDFLRKFFQEDLEKQVQTEKE